MSIEEAAASALRRHVKAEKIRLPAGCFERSPAWIALYAARPFGLIALAFASVLSDLPGWLAWPAAGVLLLLAQRHFQTLVHDSSHAFFHRKREINDRLADWLAAGWIGMTVDNYRAIHFKHHAHNGSAEDPEHVSFRTVDESGGLALMALRYALLLEALRLVRKYYGRRAGVPEASPPGTSRTDDPDVPKPVVLGPGSSTEVVGPRAKPEHDGKGTRRRACTTSGAGRRAVAQSHLVLTQAALALVSFAAGAPALYALWLYLAVSFSPLLSRLRFLVEHPGESDLTVTTESGVLERPFFAPFNFNCHFEHHCWPSLPPYRLRRANRYLRDQGFYKRHPEYANRSFTGSLIQRASGADGAVAAVP